MGARQLVVRIVYGIVTILFFSFLFSLGAYLRADAATRKAAKRAKTERPEPPTTAAPATSATNRPATFAQALNISSASIQQQATQQLQQQQSMQAGGHFYEANSPATGRRLGGW